MIPLLLAAALLTVGSGAYLYYVKSRELESLRSMSHDVIRTNRHMYKTMASGLYFRFRTDDAGEREKLSETYAKSNPYEFEYFVADIWERLYGGEAFVTQQAGVSGVDIEYTRSNGGLVVLQAKCSKEDVAFEAVAIIHSEAVKRNARGSAVVSTGAFTPGAKAYAETVGVELIDGIELVRRWEQCLDRQRRKLESSLEQPSGLRPAFASSPESKG